jgi:restriction system protein
MALLKELEHLRDKPSTSPMDIVGLLEDLINAGEKAPLLSVASVIVPERKTPDGVLIASVSAVWDAIVVQLTKDWKNAFDISPEIWEQIVAGALWRDGFDEVTITPRSGDHGRDVIAVRKGFGSLRVLGSVKAYKPGLLVTKEEVHALMGAVALDPNASKGIFTTTSDFAPRIMDDPRLAQAVPHRMELINGSSLQLWLKEVAKKRR